METNPSISTIRSSDHILDTGYQPLDRWFENIVRFSQYLFILGGEIMLD